MIGGDTGTLRGLGAELTHDAEATDHVRSSIGGAANALEGTLDLYARRALHVFHGRWAQVGSVLQDLSNESRQVASGLTRLAEDLDQAERSWEQALSEARGAGFSVNADPGAPVVTAPADAKPDVVNRASSLEQRLRSAAAASEQARARMRSLLDGIPLHRLSVLGGGQPRRVAVRTGSPALDQDVHRVAGALLTAHATCSRRG